MIILITIFLFVSLVANWRLYQLYRCYKNAWVKSQVEIVSLHVKSMDTGLGILPVIGGILLAFAIKKYIDKSKNETAIV